MRKQCRSLLISSFGIAAAGLLSATAVLVACTSAAESAADSSGVDSGRDAGSKHSTTSNGTEPATDTDDPGDAAATCAPHALASPPTWRAPKPFNPSACSAAQVEGYLQSCVNGTAPVCEAFRKQNPGCAACAFTSPDEPQWGPVVTYAAENYIVANFGGCITQSLGESDDTGCGGSLNLMDQCAIEACSGCFPAIDQASLKALSACRTDHAIDPYCGAWKAQGSVQCSGISLDEGPQAKCRLGDTFQNNLRSYLTFWCSTPSDAGDAADGG